MARTFFCKLLTYVFSEDDSDVHTDEVNGQSSRQRDNRHPRKFIQRDHAQGHERLFRDYFAENPESTAMESLKRFSETIVNVFSDEYLRSSNANDIARLLLVGEQRGFPGMLGSIDCMHWKWKNCPAAWKGMYSGHIHEPTIILEAVASYDLWIWHAFFGMPGSHNDINVLERSFIFTELAQGPAPAVNYTINGNDYTMGYYLADGIYPKWRTFVKTIPSPRGNKKKNFVKAQESARKDVERAFSSVSSSSLKGFKKTYYGKSDAHTFI
ncbi:uncharacterized protein LOC122300102 [Carya illinoinensis]|uniref:uncharacterized protein LOC122300102 n=1 Tax=Carya illinoinensis TaxID=32201 RepID=UPI001C723A36|nr:uncharacterized protein LOC122300102 [Carya illinoinensis]